MMSHHSLAAAKVESNKPELTYDTGSTTAWFPFGYTGDKTHPGILIELITQVMAKAGIGLKSNPLPPKRAVYALEHGELDFDVVSPSWFKDGNIGEQYVSSKPIFVVSEYFITLKQKASQYQTLESIYGNRVGTVAGYSYFDDDQFTRVDFRSESELILGLNKNRFDVIIMERLAALHWARFHQVDIAMPLLHAKGDIVIRLRKERKELLPQIDQAISHLSQTGKIDEVLDKYHAIISGIEASVE